jgi:hypothetical protein
MHCAEVDRDLRKEPAMERERFDQVARLIGKAGTRRSALRLAATAALLGGTAAFDGVAAKGRKKRGKVRSEAASPPCTGDNVPRICQTTSSGGCGKPQGNCATKRIGPGTNLTNCNFINVDIEDTNFTSANLTGTCWLAEVLENEPNFRGANLTNACFFETELELADFRGANLTGASFCFADLNGADFRGSNLTDEQLALAGRVSCTTIKPNGKPAVQCAKGQTCNTEFGDCTCTLDSDCTVTGLDCPHALCLGGFCACSSV